MAFSSKDGKRKFGSGFQAKKYDSFHPEEENRLKKESENFEESRTDEGGESKNPHDVVSEHGKAHTVTVHHDHTANKHHVMSHHEDGHMHESEHESAQEAHDHASQLSGEGSENPESENESEGDQSNSGSTDLSSIFGGK